LRVHIFKSQTRVVKFLMKENVNMRAKLSHLTKFTITHYFSHIIRQIIRYLCTTWQWPPWIKNILLLNYAVKWWIKMWLIKTFSCDCTGMTSIFDVRFVHLTLHDLFFFGITMRKTLHHNVKMLQKQTISHKSIKKKWWSCD
jgi:hypothetical protein